MRASSSSLLLPATLLTVLATHAPLGAHAWETAAEAARQARALLNDEHVFGVGVLSSVYPDSFRIPQLRGRVASGPEYFAPCYDNGDLALLALTVSQNWRNVLPSLNGSGTATFTVSANPDPAVPDPRHTAPRSHSSSKQSSGSGAGDSGAVGDGGGGGGGGGLKWDPARPTWRRGMPSKNRIALFGSIEELSRLPHAADAPASSASESTKGAAAAAAAHCYLRAHPDAAHWAPGAADSPHTALWVRFRVQEAWWTGGYGDEHAIEFLPMELYRRSGGGGGGGGGGAQSATSSSRLAGDGAESGASLQQPLHLASDLDVQTLFGATSDTARGDDASTKFSNDTLAAAQPIVAAGQKQHAREPLRPPSPPPITQPPHDDAAVDQAEQAPVLLRFQRGPQR